MQDPQFKEGEVVTINKVELECSFVSWRDRGGARENFVYSFRPKSDMDAEREATGQTKKEEEK